MRIRNFSMRIAGSMTLRIFKRVIGFLPWSLSLANPRSRRNDGSRRNDVMKFGGMRTISMAALFVLPLCCQIRAQDPLAAAIAQFEHEPDPVRKARELARFGDDQISLASREYKSGDDVGSLHTLEQYRDEVLTTFQELKATGANAEKKPAGFKELQISLRQTTRHMEDLIFILPVDKRPFFQAVRAQVVKMQGDLMDELFPRNPNQNSKKPNP